MVNFGPLTAEIGSGVWGTPANFNGFGVLAALLHGILVVGVSKSNFVALNRGRHLYSAGRLSRWALAHILVVDCCTAVGVKYMTNRARLWYVPVSESEKVMKVPPMPYKSSEQEAFGRDVYEEQKALRSKNADMPASFCRETPGTGTLCSLPTFKRKLKTFAQLRDSFFEYSAALFYGVARCVFDAHQRRTTKSQV